MPRRGMRPVIKSDKHEITWSSLGQNASTTQNIVLLVGTPSADKDASTEVEVGSRVNYVYFEFHFSAAQTSNANVIHWQVSVDYTGQTDPIANLYYGAQRSQIMKRGMEMLPVNVATVFKRIFVVKIPPRFRRIPESTSIKFRYQASSTQTINACGIAIYKEFY